MGTHLGVEWLVYVRELLCKSWFHCYWQTIMLWYHTAHEDEDGSEAREKLLDLRSSRLKCINSYVGLMGDSPPYNFIFRIDACIDAHNNMASCVVRSKPLTKELQCSINSKYLFVRKAIISSE